MIGLILYSFKILMCSTVVIHVWKNITFWFRLHIPFVWKTEIILNGSDVQSCKGEKISKSFPSDEDMQNGRVGGGNYGPDYPSATGCIERVGSSPNVPGVSIAMAQSSVDPEFVKSLSVSDPAVPAKARKLNVERSDSRRYVTKVIYA